MRVRAWRALPIAAAHARGLQAEADTGRSRDRVDLTPRHGHTARASPIRSVHCRVNVPLKRAVGPSSTGHLLDEARGLGIDLVSAARDGLREAVIRARATPRRGEDVAIPERCGVHARKRGPRTERYRMF